MIDLKKDFPESSLNEWIDQLVKDLKGESPEVLNNHDSIEEISFPSYFHQESMRIAEQAPGKESFTRGMKATTNSWNNGFSLLVHDAQASNKKALEVLMMGVDLLEFDLRSIDAVDPAILFKEIEFEHITTQITPANANQMHIILKHFGNNLPQNIHFNIDLLESDEQQEIVDLLFPYLEQRQFPCFLANGYGIQSLGGNTWQEIAFCLSTGHLYLDILMSKGLDVDQAAACIHFSIGIGSNYFNEISKVRALKQNWASVISAYHAQHACSHYCKISAHVGFLNKSLKDPHTNLLRQTTEAMSALSGGVDHIFVHAYDQLSEQKASTLAERMAINIPLLLQEESYFSKVIDPLGGSYAVENITQLIAEKSWQIFQEIEGKGGINTKQAQIDFMNTVQKKAQERIELVRNGKQLLVGMNKFTNPVPTNNTWDVQRKYLGYDQLIIEIELNGK